MAILARINDSDWEEAFSISHPPQPTEGYKGSLAPFSREDVAKVIAAEDGENDGDHWEGVFRLKDGRFVFVTAWCDYTGWGCRDGGQSWVAADLDSLIRWGLPEESRKRLGLRLKPSASRSPR